MLKITIPSSNTQGLSAATYISTATIMLILIVNEFFITGTTYVMLHLLLLIVMSSVVLVLKTASDRLWRYSDRPLLSFVRIYSAAIATIYVLLCLCYSIRHFNSGSLAESIFVLSNAAAVCIVFALAHKVALKLHERCTQQMAACRDCISLDRQFIDNFIHTGPGGVAYPKF